MTPTLCVWLFWKLPVHPLSHNYNCTLICNVIKAIMSNYRKEGYMEVLYDVIGMRYTIYVTYNAYSTSQNLRKGRRYELKP